jgi:hypothetical protein
MEANTSFVSGSLQAQMPLRRTPADRRPSRIQRLASIRRQLSMVRVDGPGAQAVEWQDVAAIPGVRDLISVG